MACWATTLTGQLRTEQAGAQQPDRHLGTGARHRDDSLTRSARPEITHCRLPQLDSIAFAAKLRSDDVKADEAEFLSISDRRNAAHRRTGNFADEEPLRVGGKKALCIMQAGIPTFRRRPICQQLHFLRRDIADLHCFRQCSRAPHHCQSRANRVLRVAVR